MSRRCESALRGSAAHTRRVGVHIDRAMALVLKDLEVTGARIPRVEDSDWQDWPGAESAFLWSADKSGVGVWIDTARSEAEQIVMLAEQVQDWAVEELARVRATNWPACL